MKKYIKFLLCSSLITACLYQVAAAKNLISLQYNPDEGIVSISGNAGKEYAGENVTVTVMQAGLGSADVSGITKENVSGYIQYATQVKIENDGSFDDVFPIFNGVTGNYNVRISCPGENALYVKDIYYVTSQDVDELLAQVNSSQDSQNVKKLIKAEKLNNLILPTAFKELDDEDIDKVSNAVFQNKPFETVSDIVKDVKEESILALFKGEDKSSIIEGYVNEYNEYFAKNPEVYTLYSNLTGKNEVFENIVGQEYSNMNAMCENFEQNVIIEYLSEQSVWTFIKSELLSYSEKYPQYPVFKSLDLAEFKALSDNKQYSVVQKIITNNESVTGAESFAQLFNQAIKDAKNTSASNSGSGSGSGSGGGSQSVSDSGFGGVSMSNPSNSGKTESVFADLESVAWAKDAILALKEKGIVSGRSETEFAPTEPVKREEFIKMLTVSFGLEANGYAADFKDIEINSWYHPYVSTAQKHKIAYGDEEGNFGVGKNITREDMAVMLYRIVALQGVDLAEIEEQAVFSDCEEISDYAREAVSLLQQANVINGMENGTFMPKKTSTRAEAAVMLYGILKTAGKV